jgi:hypothetical protein
MTPLEWFGWQSPSVSSVVVASSVAASSAAAAVNPISTAGVGSEQKLPTVSAAKRELQSADECVAGDRVVTRRGSTVEYGGFGGLPPRPLKRARDDSQGWAPLHTSPEFRFWSSWVIRRPVRQDGADHDLTVGHDLTEPGA